MNAKLQITRSLACITLGVATACSPQLHPEVEKSERALQILASNPDADALASRELREASDAVQRAKRDWYESENEEEALHLSYLAARRIEIAQVKLAEKQAELSAERMKEKREAVVENAKEAQAIQAEAAAINLGLEAEKLRKETEARIAENNSLKEKLSELEAENTERGLQLTIGDVLFDSDGATLKPGATHSLKPLAAFLEEHPSHLVEVEGHTDNKGSSEYNKSLSQRRADAVRDLLVELNVEPERISSRGLGEAYPRATNDNIAGRLENRRVELIIKDQS